MIQKNMVFRTVFYFCMSAIVLVSASLVHASAGEVPAAAALVMDASSEKILYAKNPNLKLRPASTTKLITAMLHLIVWTPTRWSVSAIMRQRRRRSPSSAGRRAFFGQESSHARTDAFGE